MAYAIKKGSDYFKAVTYTGNGSTNAITVGFQPDFIWIKRRNGSPSDSHVLQDSVRGLDKFLSTNSTNAEASQGDSDGVTSYDANGFTLGYTDSDAWNSNTNTYVSWNWRGSDSTAVTNTDGTITSQVSANPTSGFSVVTYTANGTAGATVGHGLGTAPSMIIIKDRSATFDWSVYHSGIGNTKYIFLNRTDAAATSATFWNNTSPTSNVFTLGSTGFVNNNGSNLVAYCFAEVEGFSKFGSYTGNGSADGSFVYTGFRPAFVILKYSSGASDWMMHPTDNSTSNPAWANMMANNSVAERTGSTYAIDFLSNGFKLRTSDVGWNANGGTYIYMAFAETPLKYATAR